MNFATEQETRTNIIGLPVGPGNRYFTERGYSQIYPYKEIARSPSGKTRTLVPVNTKRNPDWKPVMHAGGFVAHCSNQSEQTWLYDGLGSHEITIRWSAKKEKWVRGGTTFREGEGYFYDYHFRGENA